MSALGGKAVGAYGISEIIFVISSIDQARTVRLRTKPKLQLASVYLAMLASFAVSMILHQIVFAGGEINLFDFAVTFLGKLLRCLRAFGIIFDFTNAPLGEVQGHYEQHDRA